MLHRHLTHQGLTPAVIEDKPRKAALADCTIVEKSCACVRPTLPILTPTVTTLGNIMLNDT